MAELYQDDLAFIQASGFGELARAAIATVIPELKKRGARRVLDLGCGAGVSTQALLAAKFETLAIETSAALLEQARSRAPGAQFREASVYETELEDCDAILAIGEVLTYHAPDADADARLRAFFRRAQRALPPRGLLVFDLIETGSPSLDARTWKSGPDWAVLSASNEDVDRQRLTRHIETFRELGGGSYRRSSETHHVRLFTRADVVAWLEQAGFAVDVTTAYGSFALAARRAAFWSSRL